MSCRGSLDVVAGHLGDPVWDPLLRAVGERLTETFMYMQGIRLEDGTSLHAYKHIHTRCYLHLSDDGEAYERLPCEAFLPLRLDYALEAALCNWWFLAGWEQADATAVRDAILEANTKTANHPRPLRNCGPIP